MGLLDQLTPRKTTTAGTEFVYGPNSQTLGPAELAGKTVGEVLNKLDAALKLPKDVTLDIYVDGVPVDRSTAVAENAERIEVRKQAGQKG